MRKSINKLDIQKLSLNDYEQLLIAMKAAYPDWSGSYWSMNPIKSLIEKFSAGQIVIKADGEVVGCALSIIIDDEKFEDHTYKEITGNYLFDTHDPN